MPNDRYKTPGRGGSAPAGDRPKKVVHLTVDCNVLKAARSRRGDRGRPPVTRYRTRADLRRPSLAQRIRAALWRLRRPVAGQIRAASCSSRAANETRAD